MVKYGSHLGLHGDVFERIEGAQISDVIHTVDVRKVDELLVHFVKVDKLAIVLLSGKQLLEIHRLDHHLDFRQRGKNLRDVPPYQGISCDSSEFPQAGRKRI